MGKQLSPEKIDALYEKLYPLTQVDEAQKLAHVENIHREHHRTPVAPADAEATEEKRCPRCGGKLVMRTAARGDRAGKTFWGRSNYPKCRYLENIEP